MGSVMEMDGWIYGPMVVLKETEGHGELKGIDFE